MRHRVSKGKLGRRPDHQLALRRNLVFALLQHGQIRTTLAKAKMLRPIVEKLITLAKRGNADESRKYHYELNAISFFTSGQNKRVFVKESKNAKAVEQPRIVKKLFNEIAPAYETRPGGYTRINKLGRRLGDNAEMAIISLV
jgi:large subunit ribosomal protein L17